MRLVRTSHNRVQRIRFGFLVSIRRFRDYSTSESGPVPQDPTACRRPGLAPAPVPAPKSVLGGQRSSWSQCQCSTHELPAEDVCFRSGAWTTIEYKTRGRQMLLRKEVIQPHLPVRLPCYDLVLITNPTFDSSLLAVGPLASGVTDFHDLTGGVYKARERIHRSVADLRLLATPTSRGRVADPDPN